jgi:hypothetical protein
LRSLQAVGEVGGRGAGNKVTVWVTSGRQLNYACRDADTGKALRELVSGVLSGLIFILIKDDVDQTIRLFGKLMELKWRQVGADGAGGVAKTGLPEDGQVEKSFHEYHGGRSTHGVPCNEAAFGTWQQAVRKSSSDTASIQVDDLAVLPAWEDGKRRRGPGG